MGGPKRMRLSIAGRLSVLLALMSCIAQGASGAALTDRQHTSIAEPRPSDVPSDAVLEARGTVVGKIEFDTRNLFDSSDPRENVPLFRLANRLHIRTKRSTIAAQLLFATGERYNGHELTETERNLRKLPYIYDARVVPVRYHDGRVDIKVITKDVWTLSPGISFGRAGGANNSQFDIQEENFLGWGKTLEFSRGRDVDRSTNSFLWGDRNVFGSRWTDRLIYAQSSDGKQRSLQLVRPFYSLESKWSVQLSAQEYDRTVSRYALGKIGDQFNDDETSYEFSDGISKGLQNGWTRRWLAGMRFTRDIFAATPGTSAPARTLPPNRTLSYPFVGFDILQDDYEKIGDLNQIGRTEDLYLGTEVTGELGISEPAFGALRDAVMLAASARTGFQFDSRQLLFLTSNFSSRVERGRTRNLIVDGSVNYYWRWHPDWVLYASFNGTVTDALDPDAQLLIGGDSGLRGYPLRYEAGTSRALVTIEQRVYTDWYPFRLARVGAAAFADVGRTWGSEVIGNSDQGLLSDIGFGLRLGNTRSGLGNVLHIDVAVPIGAPAGIAKVQLLIQTMQSF